MDLEPSFLIDHTEVRYFLYYYLLLLIDLQVMVCDDCAGFNELT